MIDVAFIETGNGGEVKLVGNDLQMYYYGENNIYFGLFGGNKEPIKNKFNEDQNFEWWGNKLFFEENKSIQFVSTVERFLQDTPLTSSGRVMIENAMKGSLKFMDDIGEVTVVVTIVATDRINADFRWYTQEGIPKVLTVKFGKTEDGDFFALDFNSDFL